MGVPDTITTFLRAHDISFHVVEHAATACSAETAEAAHVPGDLLAKGIVVCDGERYLVAVIPASHRLDTEALADLVHRRLGLAAEEDFALLFRDCRPGAVPPIGEAYGVPTILDDAFTDASDVYLEAGDHEHLIHLDRAAFGALMAHAAHGRISQRA